MAVGESWNQDCFEGTQCHAESLSLISEGVVGSEPFIYTAHSLW